MIRDRICAIARFAGLALMLLLLWLVSGNVRILGLLVFLMLIPAVSLLSNLYVRKHICAAIRIPTTATKGTACMASVQLENKSRLPAVKLYCRVGMINDLTGEENTLEFISGLGPGSSSVRDFLLESRHCGRIYLYVQSVKVLDYFGLFAMKVPLKAAARITMLPELFSCDVQTNPVCAVSDEDSAARRGDDRTEVFQLREYQTGDDIRQIHWKLSSKLDKLILREPSQSVSRSLLVFWDKREQTEPEKMDAMAEVTASVCQALCDIGVPFDLCWTEKDELEVRQIRGSDSLLQSIPAMVTQRGIPECPEPPLADYGRIVRIAAKPAEENEKTVQLICTDTDFTGGGCIAFSHRDYSQKLERLEL